VFLLILIRTIVQVIRSVVKKTITPRPSKPGWSRWYFSWGRVLGWLCSAQYDDAAFHN